MADATTRRLQRAITEVIQAQIRTNSPPETGQTLNRLIQQGFSEQQALQLISHVVAKEIFDVVQQGKRYDEHQYINRLNGLPELPWKPPGRADK